MARYVCQECGREDERSALCVTCPACGGPLVTPGGRDRRVRK